ncbi:hypothetical protein FI667_g6483, partial [Globisporangium splendens]
MTRKQANALFSYRQAAASSSSSIYDPVSAALEKRARGIDFLDSFGLRIASLHAKYFGGDLSLMPMEGHGVDAYIYMNCLTGSRDEKEGTEIERYLFMEIAHAGSRHLYDEVEKVAAHLDLVLCSSADSNFPAHNLQTKCYSNSLTTANEAKDHEKDDEEENAFLPALHGGWLYLLSHYAKIASRIEIFTSSYAHRRLEWETHASFQRLGFVSFQANEQSNFTTRELKIIAFPMQEKITMIRLVLHSCHANQHNLFEQVGLLSVVAAQVPPSSILLRSSASWDATKGISSLNELSYDLPPLRYARSFEEHGSESNPDKQLDHVFSSSLSPIRSKYANALSPSRMIHGARSLDSSSPSHLSHLTEGNSLNNYEIWIPELKEYRTPLQISTHTRLRVDRARSAGSKGAIVMQAWKSTELECRHLDNKLEILQRTYNDTSHLIVEHDRVALQDEIDSILQEFGTLGSKVVEREVVLKQRLSSPDHLLERHQSPHTSIAQVFPDLENSIQSEIWQVREDAIWELVAFFKGNADNANQNALMEEALYLVKPTLQDANGQVLLLHARCFTFAEWSRQASGAFIVERQCTFVLHPILKKLEKKQFQLTDQVLYAVLKLISALLQSFHCCASIDIAPRRIFRFLLRSDAEFHANPHVRETAKQLTLAMYAEVGSDIMQSYLVKLPLETQEMDRDLFRARDETNT